MPRIRKKTTKRGTTHQRRKIIGKATESRKKAKREAKRNPQWKSKNPKDPGIPNNFPFKDQVLAEIAEQRRKADEEKAARKEAKKSAKAQAKLGAQDDDDGSGSDDEGVIGVDGLSASRILASTSSKGKEKAVLALEEDSAPLLVNPDLPHLQSVLDAADVLIQVLDARDPLPYLSTSLDEKAVSQGKKVIYVLTKIDTCTRESLSAWAAHLRHAHPTFYFRAASRFLPQRENSVPLPAEKARKLESSNDSLGADAIIALLGTWAVEKPEGETLTVAVTGVVNVGKSAFVNSLARKAASTVYLSPTYSASLAGPTTTPHAIEIPISIGAAESGGLPVRLIDTPGLSFAHQSAAESADVMNGVEGAENTVARDILLRSRGRIEKSKNTAPLVAHIVGRAKQEDLMMFYSLPAYAKDDPDAFLGTLARVSQFTKKGGNLDTAAASRLLLRDWATGKLPRYSVPSKGPEVIDFAAAPANANEVHLEDVKTLENVQTRVEKRKASGLVRISAGMKDSREPEWERRWDSVGGRGAESDGDDDGDVEGDAMDDLDEEDEVGEDDDEDEDDEDEVASIITAENSEEEDEEEEVPPPPPAKRKRVPLEVAASAPASKRVAFGKAAPSAKSNPAVSLVTPAPKSVLKPVKSSRSSLRALKADKPKPKSAAPSAVDSKKPKVSVSVARKTQKKANPGVVVSLSKTRSAKIASKSAAGKDDDGAYKFGEFF